MTDDLFAYRPETPLQTAAEGPLDGTTVLIRPDISVTGWLTDAGSPALADFHALSDATVAARLQAAGATLVGSTRMAELGFGLNGDTMADALAANLARTGLMIDLLGEARLAACAAGCFGFKPSYGLLSQYGLVGLAPSLESVGILAPSPGEISGLLAIMAGPDEADFSLSADPPPDFSNLTVSGDRSIRLGVPEQCREFTRPALTEVLSGTGCELFEVDLSGFDLFSDVHQAIAAVEASSAAGRYDGVRFGHRAAVGKNWNEMYINTRGEAFGLRIKSFLFQGAWFQFHNYPGFEDACALRGRLVREIEKLLQQVDLLALPTRHTESDPFAAETVEETYTAFGLTLAANVTGLPALHIPGANREATLDYGLQLIGPALADAAVLAAGWKIANFLQGNRSA